MRAIRHGIGADGRSLVIMPSYEFSGISDEQLGQLVAYLESVAPVNRDFPEPKFGLMGRTLFIAGQFPTLLPAEVVDHMAVACLLYTSSLRGVGYWPCWQQVWWLCSFSPFAPGCSAA